MDARDSLPEKLISGFSDSVNEFRLGELSLKARYSRLLIRALQIKRVFRALFSADELDGLLRSQFSASQTLSAQRALTVSAFFALTCSGSSD
jgi:hypothetical protein